MRYDNECPCCRATYTIRFEQMLADLDPDSEQEPIDDQDAETYPEYCPFCGVHISEEGEEDEE